MKWYLGIIAWVADAIKRKAEVNKSDSVDARLERIERKLDQVIKSSIPVALFASGLPIYLIGFAGSLKNAIDVISFEWNNLLYLVVGSLLVTYAMARLSESKRKIYLTIILTFGTLIVVNLINLIRFT